VDLAEKIIDATKEIFSSMIMMEISLAGDIIEQPSVFKGSISGVIGLAGTYRGLLGIHLPQEVAMAITSSFLGMEVTEIDEDVEDAVGELANMLGGNIKSILSEKGRDIDLSLPSIIKGAEYDFQQTQKDAERYVIPMRCDAGEFCIDLQLKQ
jgi:chemotaxis protein CheX